MKQEKKRWKGGDDLLYCTTARSVGVTGQEQKTDVLVGEQVMQGRGDTPFVCPPSPQYQ